MRIAGIVNDSITDGLGIRITVFVQGCLHNCFGCHNPETHSLVGGELMSIDEIMELIKRNPLLDGVTLSGGDPFFQASECLELVKRIRKETSLNIWCYTGFTFNEIMKSNIKEHKELLKSVDILVDGKYIHSLRKLSLHFRGSSNQRLIDVNKTFEKINKDLGIIDSLELNNTVELNSYIVEMEIK